MFHVPPASANTQQNMKRSVVSVITVLSLLGIPAYSQYQDPFAFQSNHPSDCDVVRGMMDLKTRKMNYFYINTCNRANFWQFSQLSGVKLNKSNVIYIPTQTLGNKRSIGGYFCSNYPNLKVSRLWSCRSHGWVSAK